MKLDRPTAADVLTLALGCKAVGIGKRRLAQILGIRPETLARCLPARHREGAAPRPVQGFPMRSPLSVAVFWALSAELGRDAVKVAFLDSLGAVDPPRRPGEYLNGEYLANLGSDDPARFYPAIGAILGRRFTTL